MEKQYKRTYWKNAPDKTTPVNAENLDNIEAGIDGLDDRVIELKSDLSEVYMDYHYPLSAKLSGFSSTGEWTSKEYLLTSVIDASSEDITVTITNNTGYTFECQDYNTDANGNYVGTAGYFEVASGESVVREYTGVTRRTRIKLSGVTDATSYLDTVIGGISCIYKHRYHNLKTDAFGYTHDLLTDRLYRDEHKIKNLEKDLYSPQTEYTSASDYEDEELALYNKVHSDIDDNTLVFAVTTDTHYSEGTSWGDSQLRLANIFTAIAEKNSVDAIFHLGDMIDEVDADGNYRNEEYVVAMMRQYSKTKLPFLYAQGHHELYEYLSVGDGSNVTTYSREKCFGHCGRHSKHLTMNRHYADSAYYIDFDFQRVRLIVLDSTTYAQNGFSTQQIAWLETVLGNVPNDYKVLVASHTGTRESATGAKYKPNQGALVENALETFVSNGGTVLAHIHGHQHWDNIVQDEDMSYPLISLCCGSVIRNGIDSTGISGNPTNYPRTNNTYSENCFDIMCIHADTGVINMYRFGAGNDRNYTPTY